MNLEGIAPWPLPCPAMLDAARDFGPFDGPFDNRVWLNAAHQGPLPRVAVEAAKRAIQLKVSPHELTTSACFNDVPARLRNAIGRLLSVDADDCILGNSTSYGLNIIANGVRWREDDEVLLVEGDFPAAIFPWLPLRERGVNVRTIQPRGSVGTAEDADAAITARTRLLCTTWVHSFTGYVIDAKAIAAVCREKGVRFVLNVSQGAGARVLSPREIGVDAVSGCGFKWLCGPYATGYTWIDPAWREELQHVQGYWLANLTADDLEGGVVNPALREDLGARAYDLTCPANFMSFMPWTASIEYLLDVGIDAIAQHDQALVQHLIDGVNDARWIVCSPREEGVRSTLVYLEARDGGQGASGDRTVAAFDRLREGGIDVSLRQGRIRIAPHLYNTIEEIDRVIDLLNRP